MMSEDDDWPDELIREFEQKIETRKLRNENPHVMHLIRILWPFAEGGLIRRYAIERVWRLRNGVGVRMPKEFEAAVQSAFNNYCEKSDVFVRRNAKVEEALFYPVGRKGSGRWAVDRNRAEAWLKKKNFESR
jgi:hypothetical protein